MNLFRLLGELSLSIAVFAEVLGSEMSVYDRNG
jgi:hypothetical protein